MTSRIFRPGNRLFSAGSIGLLVAAVLHTIGSVAGGPEDPMIQIVVMAMKGYRFDFGPGMNPSVWDINQSLTFTMSILVLIAGVQNLVTLGLVGGNSRVVRGLSGINALSVGGLIVLYAVYRVTPPLLVFAAVEVFFVLAFALAACTEPAALSDLANRQPVQSKGV